MAINITDGFNLQYSAPIDYRIVASGSSERNAITYKYDGLKVFDRFDRITYVWDSSLSTWSVDNYGVVSGTGTLNYIPKVVGSGLSGLVLGNSIIYATGSFVGINSNVPKGFLQIGSLGDVGTKPFVIHKSGPSAQLGYNWYYDSGDQAFSLSSGASRITLGESYISLETTVAGGSFLSGPGKKTIYASEGKVGIGRASGPFSLMVEGLIQGNTGEGAFINVGGHDIFVGSTVFSGDVHVNIGSLLSGNYGYLQVTSGGNSGNGVIGTSSYPLYLQPGGGGIYTSSLSVAGNLSLSGTFSMVGDLTVTGNITATGNIISPSPSVKSYHTSNLSDSTLSTTSTTPIAFLAVSVPVAGDYLLSFSGALSSSIDALVTLQISLFSAGFLPGSIIDTFVTGALTPTAFLGYSGFKITCVTNEIVGVTWKTSGGTVFTRNPTLSLVKMV